jgi:hypothetical protein
MRPLLHRQGSALVALEPRGGGGGCECRNNRYVGGSNEPSNGIARPRAPEKWGAQGSVIIVTDECRCFLVIPMTSQFDSGLTHI